MNPSSQKRSYFDDVKSIQSFCKEHRIGFGGEDKAEDDESKYTIAFETVGNVLIVYIVEDETEDTDQTIIDKLSISMKDADRDILFDLLQKCQEHNIITLS